MNSLPSAENPLWSPVPEYARPPAAALGLLEEARRELATAISAATGGDSRCRACGQCCDFRNVDHVLFATKLELDAALHWASRHLRVDMESAGSALRSNLCPFQAGGRCLIYSVRPLGCRSYFCSFDEKKVVLEAATREFSVYRRKLMAHEDLCWYGPALTFWSINLNSLIGSSSGIVVDDTA